MSDAQAVFKPSTPTGPEGEDEWCAKEVLGHVLASQRGLNVTIAQMAGVEPPARGGADTHDGREVGGGRGALAG